MTLHVFSLSTRQIAQWSRSDGIATAGQVRSTPARSERVFAEAGGGSDALAGAAAAYEVR